MINGIEVTDVILFPLKVGSPGKTKAFVKVVLNDQFVISGIRVVEGKSGPFITFPQEYSKEQEKHYDICFPTTVELRAYISNQVLEQYEMTRALTAKTTEVE